MSAAGPVRVLLVEDDPDDYALMVGLFEDIGGDHPYQLDWEMAFESALEDLRQHRHDVYLVDFRLGSRTGLDLLKETESDRGRPPVIILTGHGNASIDRRVMSAGAADYLVKAKLDAEQLERSLRYTVERSRLNQRLGASERSYRLLFDASPMPMWLTDPQSQRFLAVNQAAISHYGYSREEFLGMRLSDLRSDESVWEATAGATTAAAGHIRAGVWRHVRKDGSVIDVSISRNDITFGSRTARLMLAEDVTDRRAAEVRLLENEATLRKVLRDAADALLVVDAGGVVRYVNAAVPRLLGQSPEMLLDQPAPPVLLGGNRDGIEITDAAGSTHVVDIRSAESAWNGMSALIVAVRDMTEARANERQLRLLRRAMEASPNGVTISDARAPDCPIIYVNPAFERITGYSAGEALGRNCRFLQGEERDQEALAIVRAAVASQSDCDVVLKNFRKDGTLFWNQLLISPVRDERGRVTHFVGVQSDVTEQKRAEAERTYFASHDVLTGLPKYPALEARLQALIDRAREEGNKVAVLFLDMDAFHTVNDTFGYAIGDTALVEVAKRLRARVPADAELARFAGDEFVIVVPDCPPEMDLLALAQGICADIALPLAPTPDATLYLTCSIGVSAFPDTGTGMLQLLRQADLATNRAKRSGRDSAFLFTLDLEEGLNDRMALGSRLREALEREEFLLHYQPQVSAHNGEVTGLEALVRWNSPELGLLPPRRFIPVAEDSGMILQLGNWVLRSACKQCRQWLDMGYSGFTVAVNVSASQMQRPSFVDEVRSALEQSGIPASMLELELTESLLMENVERAEAHMHALKRVGVSLSLDDFGMGYSSLAYLQRFPLDKLKIDQSFIRDLSHTHGDAAIARAIIAMGHQLEMKIVAEGVETPAQFGYLRRNHCDEFQGHFFSEPVPSEQIAGILRNRFIQPELFAGESVDRTLLLLDDEENILRALTRLLRRDGYRILTATNAADAFDLLARNEVQVIVSDQRMPNMSGTEFLSQVKQMYPRTMRLVLSGYTDLASVTDAINRGAIYKFLTKPWDDEQLRSHIQEAFRRFA